MKRPSFRHILPFALIGLLAGQPSLAAPLTGEELAALVGVPAEQRAKLESGKIISYSLDEKSDKELAMGVATIIALPVADVIARLSKLDLAAVDPDIIARGNLSPNAGPEAFKAFAFKSKDGDEAEALLEAEAGDRFNLSTQEIADLKAASAKLGDVSGKALIDAASEQYRKILFQRWQAYRKAGLSGLGTYTRTGAAADPAAELRLAATSSRVLARQSPDFHQAWLNYPAAFPAGMDETWRWVVRKVEDRPTPILIHRVRQSTGDGMLIASREYYVGHSYNSSQLLIGILPYGEKTAVFYVHRSFTDQVAGMGSSLKHSIGRDRLKDEMVNRLRRAQTLVEKAAAGK